MRTRPTSRGCWSWRARGLCGDGAALRHPWLLLSPAVHAIFMVILPDPDERFNLPERRERRTWR